MICQHSLLMRVGPRLGTAALEELLKLYALEGIAAAWAHADMASLMAKARDLRRSPRGHSEARARERRAPLRTSPLAILKAFPSPTNCKE